MEFEASEPIDGSFASRGDILKDLGDAAVVADFLSAVESMKLMPLHLPKHERR
jgi:hypothetical protein